MASKKSNFRKVTFTLTDDDNIEFNRYYIQNTKRGRKVVWQQRMIFPAVLVGYVALMLIFKFNSTPVYYFGGAIVLAAIGYGVMAERNVLNQQTKNIMRESYSLENIHAEPTTLEFTDEAIEANYKGQEQRFEYEEIWMVSKTDKAIYVWLNDIVAMQIPERAFSSDSHKNQLFDLLKDKCVNAIIDEGGKTK